MKKWDGPSLSWPTPHTTPFFLPPEDPFPVLLRHNSTPLWEPDPALARRLRQQQAGTGYGRPERAPGRHRRAVTPPPQCDDGQVEDQAPAAIGVGIAYILSDLHVAAAVACADRHFGLWTQLECLFCCNVVIHSKVADRFQNIAIISVIPNLNMVKAGYRG